MNRLSPELEAFFNESQAIVDKALLDIIKPHKTPVPNLDDGMAYALGLDSEEVNTGKRIRPILCLLVCHELSGNSRPALPFAAAIELMHNFALVHDDIEDGDEMRRGRPAVWKKYGLPHAINIGDYLFTKVFEALLLDQHTAPPDRQVRLFELMRSTLDHTHRGQALDMNARYARITVDDYMTLVTEKTGHYLAAPMIAGAICADADATITTALATFGLMIGPMFQIRDDVIDLTHGKGRGAIGNDIREGKRSFLVAHSLQHATPEDQENLLRILDLPRTDITDDNVNAVLAIFERCGAMKAADNRCAELREKAIRALQPLPDNLRERLLEVTEHLIARTV